MGFLDEIRKKNKLAKSLVSNGLAPHFDVAVKMVEARMRHESGAQDPIGEMQNAMATGLPSTNLRDLRYVVSHETPTMTLDEQRSASIAAMSPTRVLHERQTGLSMTSAASAAAVSAAAQPQHHHMPQHIMNNGLSNTEIEKVLSENTKFITEQLIEFKTQIASIAATVELLQKELADAKRQMHARPAPSAPTFSASSVHNQSVPAHEEKKQASPSSRNPSSRDIKPEDVSIEKMFNFSHKKFK